MECRFCGVGFKPMNSDHGEFCCASCQRMYTESVEDVLHEEPQPKMPELVFVSITVQHGDNKQTRSASFLPGSNDGRNPTDVVMKIAEQMAKQVEILTTICEEVNR